MSRNTRQLSIAKAGALNVAISLIAAAATFLALALVARRFGGSEGCDAYFYLLSLTTASTALIGGVFSGVFLPILIETRVRDGIQLASTLVSGVLSWSIVIGLVLGLGVFVFHDAFFASVSKFKPSVLYAQRDLLIFFGPIFFFSITGECLRATLIGLGRYSVAASIALLQPTILIIFLIVPLGLEEDAMALALLVARLALVLLAVYTLKKSGLRFKLTLEKNQIVEHFIRLSTPYAAAGVITQLATFFSDYMATGLDAGVLTSVTYAQRVFALPLALVVVPLLEIARSRFSELRARQEMSGFQLQYEKLCQIIICFSVPVAFICFLFSHEIIAILFKRGAFSEKDVAMSAACLKILAFSIPLNCFFTLNGRTAESFQRLKWTSLFGTIGNICLMGLTFKLVGSLGFLGIPYARLLIDLFYFLPFGVITLSLFGVQVSARLILPSLLFALIGCFIPVLLMTLLKASSTLLETQVVELQPLAAIVFFLFVYGLSVLLLDRSLRSTVFKQLTCK